MDLGCYTATGLSLLLNESATAPRPRLYCRGEQPMTRLNAVLNALSDSYPSDCAIDETGAPEFVSRSPASSIRQRVR